MPPTVPRAIHPPSPSEGATYPPPQDLVDGRTFFQRALRHDLCPHFLHIQHERVKRFLYVGLLLFFFLFGVLMLSGYRQNRQTQPHKQWQGPTSPENPAPPAAQHPNLAALKEKHASTAGLLQPGKWNKNIPAGVWGKRTISQSLPRGSQAHCFPKPGAWGRRTAWPVSPGPAPPALAGQASKRSVVGEGRGHGCKSEPV